MKKNDSNKILFLLLAITIIIHCNEKINQGKISEQSLIKPEKEILSSLGNKNIFDFNQNEILNNLFWKKCINLNLCFIESIQNENFDLNQKNQIENNDLIQSVEDYLSLTKPSLNNLSLPLNSNLNYWSSTNPIVLPSCSGNLSGSNLFGSKGTGNTPSIAYYRCFSRATVYVPQK